MATTTNYGWTTPNDTDLVKNGASAIRTLGSAVDSSLWTAGYSAGKNKIINGDFGIWQRGTSFSNPTSGDYGADRWRISYDGTGATRTVSRQAFTAGAAPVSGYESQYFYRYAVSVAGTGNTFNRVAQRIEDARTFAGQTVTISFWAKADATRSVTPYFYQNFGTGGSPSSETSIAGSAISLTTSWVRYSQSIAITSVSGKTFGTNNDSFLQASLELPSNTTQTIDFWGVQLEAGSTATAFQTATGTKQGELAACQRYYQVIGGTANGFPMATGYASAASQSPRFPISFAVTMRTAPVITKNGTWATGNTGQPAASYIGTNGFAMELSSSAAGQCYAYPDSTDDTFTCNSEL
jgi:hypothetical protein